MSLLPLIATIIAIILATSIIDIETGLLVGLLVALISLQWVSRNKFDQLQRQIEGLREQLAATTTQTAEPGPEPCSEPPPG